MPGLFYVGAGYSFSLLGSQTARQGWSGLEFASGIPGSVGGAVYMNAGANGQQTCDTLVSVDYITEEGHYLILPRAELQFAYRTSPFQTQKGAIAGATFQLESSSTARNKQLEIIRYRQDTQPYNAKSAGCVFRNPSCASAGALIQQCGLKGVSIGGAQISEKHANFLINHQNATAQDILDLIHLVQKEVYHKMEISLDIEICYIPYIENALYD
jgi:UDP-N-acetylmuramate dehydrogenase